MSDFTDQELSYIRSLMTDKSTKCNILRILTKHNPAFLEKVVNATSFLPIEAKVFERLHCILNDIHSIHMCEHCHAAPTSFSASRGEYGGYAPYCSISCATKEQMKHQKNPNNPEKAKATRLAKYGSYHNSDFSNKLKETKVRRYGDANYVNKEKAIETRILNSGSLKESYERSLSKGKETKRKRYGSDTWNNANKISQTKRRFTEEKNNSINEKRIETNRLKYGCNAPLQNPNVLDKVRQTNLQKYGVDSPLKLPEVHIEANRIKRDSAYKNMLSKATEYEPLFTYDEFMTGSADTKFLWRHKPCGERVSGRWADGKIFAHCRKCYPYGSSIAEKEVAGYIRSIYDGEVIENDRLVIKPKEIDIYIPALKLAFEYDGLFYHSEEHGAEPRHLLDKTEECNARGIRLIHIFEDEWLSMRDIVKSRIANLLGKSERVYARSCQVCDITPAEATEFLSVNHIQGSCPCKVKLALKLNDEIIAVMTFGKPRFSHNYDWELLRFCNKLGTTVVGGASKLLSYFEKHYNPKSLLSYADRRWSDGLVYGVLGFEKISDGTPNYWYTTADCSKRFSRLTFQKHNLSSVLERFDPNLTEAENMFANGYRRVYDCGNLVYVKKYESAVNIVK